ncbi:YbgC/FadM family acyl-CoA thioesterase [Enterobacter sp. WCHEn045836]|uniref:YbgC/FadM family acyl-CoA thioesterase n=1 Tax=Enterobacter sp. WCHEn045836 TaxID=2497434 RepID=UPI000F819666|nr:YbgC/FadM family acyl-CoA thioesterase [Enterobacter sp. WCHEn045836]RTP97300.1 YbgC/FadM family acyl-CoA thioesterase [Enterobacter sp. WCHEn045836]
MKAEEYIIWSSLLNSSKEWHFRVPFADIDTGKVVYHACYLRYFDQARTEWFRAHYISLAKMIEELDTAWIVCQTDISYHSPSHFDETLTITTSLSRQQHARFVFTQIVSCDGKPRVSAHISMATVSVTTLKPVRPPSLHSAMKCNSSFR